MRILSIWIGCSGTGHNQTGFLTARYDSLCTAIQGIEGDKVASLWLGPCSDTETAKLTLQGINDCLKLRTEDVSVLASEGTEPGFINEFYFRTSNLYPMPHTVVSAQLA